MKAITAAKARDARLQARARRRRRLHNTDSVDGMRLRVELHNRRLAELEPVELSEQAIELTQTAARYLDTVDLFRSLGAAPQYL